MDKEQFARELRAAEDDVRRARQRLTGQQVGAGVDMDAVAQHWRRHRGTYVTAGSLVLDELRQQVLTQLYAWRRQLGRQLQAQQARRGQRESGPSPSGDQTADNS